MQIRLFSAVISSGLTCFVLQACSGVRSFVLCFWQFLHCVLDLDLHVLEHADRPVRPPVGVGSGVQGLLAPHPTVALLRLAVLDVSDARSRLLSDLRGPAARLAPGVQVHCHSRAGNVVQKFIVTFSLILNKIFSF